MSLLGYYINCDDAECVECFERAVVRFHARRMRSLSVIASPFVVRFHPRRWAGFESWPEPLAISDSDESDTPTHCCVCGIVLEHELTNYGYDYVADAIGHGFESGVQNPVTVQWINAYGEYMDDATMPQADGVRVADAIGCYLLLPRNKEWIERAELRKYAVLAGWVKS